MMVFQKIITVERKTQVLEKASYKMIFLPEHVEDISFVYVVNQTFESASDNYQKG